LSGFGKIAGWWEEVEVVVVEEVIGIEEVTGIEEVIGSEVVIRVGFEGLIGVDVLIGFVVEIEDFIGIEVEVEVEGFDVEVVVEVVLVDFELPGTDLVFVGRTIFEVGNVLSSTEKRVLRLLTTADFFFSFPLITLRSNVTLLILNFYLEKKEEKRKEKRKKPNIFLLSKGIF